MCVCIEYACSGFQDAWQRAGLLQHDLWDECFWAELSRDCLGSVPVLARLLPKKVSEHSTEVWTECEWQESNHNLPWEFFLCLNNVIVVRVSIPRLILQKVSVCYFYKLILFFYMDIQFLPVISCKEKLLQSLVDMGSGGALFSYAKLNV